MAVAERLRDLRGQLTGHLVEAHREAGEPSYSVIAEQIGTSKATVGRLLNGVGERSPKWHHIDNLLEVFGRSDREVERLRALWVEIRRLETAAPPQPGTGCDGAT
jgi:transcriptional regulator with XRE-family HTH domain